MEWGDILQAVLSFVFVIGLLLLTLWCLKYIQTKVPHSRLFRNINDTQRIHVEELRRVDAKNSVVLLRKDDKEFLVLLGANQALVLDENSVEKKAGHND